MIRKFIMILLLAFSFACSQQIEKEVDFIEVRISRYAVLERSSETFVLRKIDNEWSSMLLGNGLFASCNYHKIVQPKSNFEDLWQKLVNEGLLEIQEGQFRSKCCTDGSGYESEIFYQGKLKRFSFHIPSEIPTKEAKQIQNIGNIISDTFETPMFYADYSRNDIGDYLIKTCEEAKTNKVDY